MPDFEVQYKPRDIFRAAGCDYEASIANRNNKYSIRRFTVGTASILIGATLLFGASHDAKAAEEDSSSVSVDGKDQAGAQEARCSRQR